MQFTDLLKKLLDNVNLGQILTDGGPGVLLALAILLLACHSIPEDSRSTIPFLKLVVKSDLRHTREEIKEIEDKAAGLAGRSAREDQEIQNLAKRIAVAEQSRVRLEPTTSCTQGSLCDLYKSVASLKEAKAKDDKQLEFTGKRLDELRAKLEKRKQEYVRDGRTLLSELVSLTIGLSVFGYILGTLFSGVNHNLWFLQAQRLVLLTVGKLWQRVRLWFAASPGEMAVIALRGKMRLKELQLGTALVLDDDSRKSTIDNMKAAIAYDGGGERYSAKGIAATNVVADAMERTHLFKTLPVTYFVGRGIISKQEYDSFVTDYFRWAQASANLILPVLIFGYALQCIANERVAGSSSLLRCLRWAENNPFWVAIIVAILLYIAAQYAYGDYKQRVRDFIRGKLAQEAQRRKDLADQKAKSNGSDTTPKPTGDKSKSDMFKEIVTLITKLIEIAGSREKT